MGKSGGVGVLGGECLPLRERNRGPARVCRSEVQAKTQRGGESGGKGEG